MNSAGSAAIGVSDRRYIMTKGYVDSAPVLGRYDAGMVQEEWRRDDKKLERVVRSPRGLPFAEGHDALLLPF